MWCGNFKGEEEGCVDCHCHGLPSNASRLHESLGVPFKLFGCTGCGSSMLQLLVCCNHVFLVVLMSHFLQASLLSAIGIGTEESDHVAHALIGLRLSTSWGPEALCSVI